MEHCAQLATDDAWQRWTITILTVLAFVLAAGGLLHAVLSTQRVERLARDERAFRDEQSRALARMGEQLGERVAAGEIDGQTRVRLAEEAKARSRAALEARGYAPRTNAMVNAGREPVAESLVRDLSASTRADMWIVGTGLILGLIASIWSTWLQ